MIDYQEHITALRVLIVSGAVRGRTVEYSGDEALAMTDHLNAIETALAALIAGVKVKPLEWENFDVWTYWARCPVGTYHVEERNGVWKATLDRNRGLELVYEYTTDGLTPDDFQAAQLAAQADYEARILAALEAATPPDLVEAGKVLEGVTPGPKWEYVESVSPDGQEWYGCGVAPIGGTEFIWLEHSAERDVPIARFIAWCREGVPALIALATAQAAQIAGLERDTRVADRALVDKYRRGGTGIFKFPDDVAAIIRKLDAAETDAATLRAENERLRGALGWALGHTERLPMDEATQSEFVRARAALSATTEADPVEASVSADRAPDRGEREAALREAAQCAIDNQDCSPWEISEAILGLLGKKPDPAPTDASLSTTEEGK